jgi:uncharacterized protein (DUF1800 family)
MRVPRVPAPRTAALAVLAAALLAGRPAAAQDPPPEPNVVYEFDTPLAPVCVDGSMPLTLEVPGGDVAGTLDATTDSAGRVTGTWTGGGRTLEASGKVKFRAASNSLKLVLEGPGERVSLKGALETFGYTGFTGFCHGRGTLAPGKNTFALDLSGSAASTARVAAVMAPAPRDRLEGTGTVQVCGAPVALAVVRSVGKAVRLSLKGGGFRWKGSGPVVGDPSSVVAKWSARGWGSKVAGLGMPLAVVPPPSGVAYADPAPTYEEEVPATPNAPTASGGPVKQWSVSPPLPAGLVLDPATGVLSGTPDDPAAATDHTVTASNLAGSATAVLNVAVRLNHAYSFAPETRTLDDGDLEYFLARTHFGVKKEELAAVKAAGYAAYVDDMLDFRSGTAVEAAAFAELVNATDPPGLQGGFPNGYQMSRWWERIMMDTDRPFQEVMAFFWHDHMPISYDVLGAGYTHFFVDYANLLRHEGAGNLRDLLLAVARDPGMLIYLDGYANNRYSPNENFGREFWELFTLGVDNGYTQADIVQAAKAFTGWQIRYDAATTRYYFAFNPALHEPGPKTILGVTIPGQNAGDDFAAVVDITLSQRPVDRYVARKVFEFFCYEGPPDSLVDAMAARLRGAGWELKPFLKDLFLSEAFLSQRSRAGRPRSPLEYCMGLVRTTGLKLTPQYMDYFQTILAQRPGEPPNVAGWPTGTLWYSASSIVNRDNMAWYAVYDRVRQASVGINVADILPPPAERTDGTVLDAVAGLMRVPLSAGQRAELLEYLNTSRQSNGTIVPSPFVGTNQAMLDERVRGLVYILAQHPSFQVK